jgi:hypothetical protein
MVEMEAEAMPAPPENLSAYMAAIGRKGGQIGGKKRLATMTKAARIKIAKRAAKALTRPVFCTKWSVSVTP